MEITIFFFVWSAATNPVAELFPVLNCYVSLNLNIRKSSLLEPGVVNLRVGFLHTTTCLSRFAAHFTTSFTLLRRAVCCSCPFGPVYESLVKLWCDGFGTLFDAKLVRVRIKHILAGISAVSLNSRSRQGKGRKSKDKKAAEQHRERLENE